MTVWRVFIGNRLILFLQMPMNDRQANSIPKLLKAIIVPFAIGSVVRCVKVFVFLNHCFITLRFLILTLATSMLVISVNVRKAEFRLSTFFRTLPKLKFKTLLQFLIFNFFNLRHSQLNLIKIWQLNKKGHNPTLKDTRQDNPKERQLCPKTNLSLKRI